MEVPGPPKYRHGIDRLVPPALKDYGEIRDFTVFDSLHNANRGAFNSPYAFFVCGLVAHAVANNRLAAEAMFKCADRYGPEKETAAWAAANFPDYRRYLKAKAVPAKALRDGDADAYGAILDHFADRHAEIADGFAAFGTPAHAEAERTLLDLFCLQHPFLGRLPPVSEMAGNEVGKAMDGFLADKATCDAGTQRTGLLPHVANPARSEFMATVAAKLARVRRRGILRILDFGSSAGRNIDALHRMLADAGGRPPEIHCVDPGRDAIAELKRDRPHLTGHVGDHASLEAEFAGERFDLMVACSVLLLLPPAMVETALAFAGRHCDAVAILDYPSNFAGPRAVPRALGAPYHVLHPFRKLLAEAGFEKFEVQALRRPLRSYAAAIYAATKGSKFLA